MLPPNPPSKIARLTVHDRIEMKTKTKTTSSSPSGIGLSLELGRGWSGHDRHGGSKSCGFTFLQMRELEHQSLIFNYIKAGLPVPFHLILPVWKSVACSLTGLSAGRLHQSNFLGCSSLFDEYKNSMEAEPGRCRRTDGKKWRCRKEVVPNHKYCERHMHRGRHRSRKHVEEPPGPGRFTTATSAAGDVVSTPTNLSPPLISLTPPQQQCTTSSRSGSNFFPRLGF